MSTVQFCLQPDDDTFIVQNRQGTDDPADDSNVVQMCESDLKQRVLHLYSSTRAVAPGCNIVVLKLAELPSPEVQDCVPVPDGQEFRLQIADSSYYLGGLVQNGEQMLTATPDNSQAIPFLSAPGRDGQITLVSANGRTLYSDQDITGSGNGPIYFDELGLSLLNLPPQIQVALLTYFPRRLRKVEHEPCTILLATGQHVHRAEPGQPQNRPVRRREHSPDMRAGRRDRPDISRREHCQLAHRRSRRRQI